MFQKMNELMLEIAKVNFIRRYIGEHTYELAFFPVGLTEFKVTLIYGGYGDKLVRESGPDLDTIINRICEKHSRWWTIMNENLHDNIKKAKAMAFKHNDTDFQKTFEEMFCAASTTS